MQKITSKVWRILDVYINRFNSNYFTAIQTCIAKIVLLLVFHKDQMIKIAYAVSGGLPINTHKLYIKRSR